MKAYHRGINGEQVAKTSEDPFREGKSNFQAIESVKRRSSLARDEDRRL